MANQATIGTIWQLRVIHKKRYKILGWPTEWNEWIDWTGEILVDAEAALAFMQRYHFNNSDYRKRYWFGIFRGERRRVRSVVNKKVAVVHHEKAGRGRKKEYEYQATIKYKVVTDWKLVQVV